MCFIAEPILEAVPQVLIIFILWGYSGWESWELTSGRSKQEGVFFLASFTSSVFSASKGIAGFLLHGPCKIVPADGLFGGMGKLGFILLVINIASTLCGKGVLLEFLTAEVSFTALAFSKIYPMMFLSYRKGNLLTPCLLI